MTLGGAVLTGGASRRMGSDKALLPVGGRPMAQRAVAALVGAAAEPVVVVGGDARALAEEGLTTVADRWPGEGPLGGIITALGAIDRPLVAVLACDLVDPSSAAVAAVADALGDADVAVPVVEGREQWLHAVWRRATRPVLEAAFDRGERAPRRAVAGLRVARLVDGDPAWFRDADRPEDLPAPG